MKNLNYLMDHILYQIFKIRYSRLFEYILEKNGEKNNDNNLSIKIYVNNIENRTTLLKQDIISNFKLLKQ